MQKRLTITLNEVVYEALHQKIGRGNISRFIEALVRPHVVGEDILSENLEAGYRAMARDEVREREALAWSEMAVADIADDMK